MAPSKSGFDSHADCKQQDDLKEPDERVDREAGEGARLRPTGDREVQAVLHDAIELDMLPHDQTDRRGKDHGAARDVSKDRLAGAPDWIRYRSGHERRHQQREENPEPVETGHYILLSAHRRFMNPERELFPIGWHRAHNLWIDRGINRHNRHPTNDLWRETREQR